MAKGRPKKVKSVSVPTEVVEEKPIEKVEEVVTESIQEPAAETSPVVPELPANNTSEVFVEEKVEPVVEEKVETTEPEVKEEVVPEAVAEMPKINDASDLVSDKSKEQKKPTRDENKLSIMIAQLKTMPMYKYLAKSSLIRIAMKKIAQQKAKTL